MFAQKKKNRLALTRSLCALRAHVCPKKIGSRLRDLAMCATRTCRFCPKKIGSRFALAMCATRTCLPPHNQSLPPSCPPHLLNPGAATVPDQILRMHVSNRLLHCSISSIFRCTRHNTCSFPDESSRWLSYDAIQCVNISDIQPTNRIPHGYNTITVSVIRKPKPSYCWNKTKNLYVKYYNCFTTMNVSINRYTNMLIRE